MAAARCRVVWTCLLLGAVLALVAVPPALAQESRGSISGTVKDNLGGALPGVTVTATQKETNRATSTVTNEAGSFNLLYLQPGFYAVTAELSGFKKTIRDNIEVRVNDRMGLDLTMEIGGIEESVTVLAESPLLETRSASQGQIIDEKRISLLPLSDGNPLILARLAPGMAYTGDLKFSRPSVRRNACPHRPSDSGLGRPCLGWCIRQGHCFIPMHANDHLQTGISKDSPRAIRKDRDDPFRELLPDRHRPLQIGQ